MADDSVRLERNGYVGTIIINRPEFKNTLNPEVLVQIADRFKTLSQIDEVRTVVIRGEGGEAFSAGYNIGEIPSYIEGNVFDELKSENPLDIAFNTIINFPYPVIAMIDGYALGAGCEMAMSCDIRIASEGSKMGIPPSRLGLIYHPHGIQKFINVMGLSAAKEVFYTGRFYEMERAREMGMVDYVVPKASITEFTYGLAEEISNNAPLALKGHKHIFNRLHHYQGVNDSDRIEIDRMIETAFNSRDLKEGSDAFFSKRKARFTGE